MLHGTTQSCFHFSYPQLAVINGKWGMKGIWIGSVAVEEFETDGDRRDNCSYDAET